MRRRPPAGASQAEPALRVRAARRADLPEVIALHRHPRKVGTASPGGALQLQATSVDELSERLTGRPPPNGGELVAAEGDAVYLLRDRRVYRWDGRREQEQGTSGQALASLMLRWSQR